jgi:hypothetical protein
LLTLNSHHYRLLLGTLRIWSETTFNFADFPIEFTGEAAVSEQETQIVFYWLQFYASFVFPDVCEKDRAQPVPLKKPYDFPIEK